jgi:uncharacterized membrane protein YcaP (DUF421 family)
MWNDLMHLDLPVMDKVIRTVVVYLTLAALLRLFGRRDLAQFTTFDLIVVLLLSNVVQNSIIGPDNSLVGGLLGAGVLILTNAVLVRIGTSSDVAERIFEGSPTVLVRAGEFQRASLRRLGLRPRDVSVALRLQGATGVEDVATAELMPSGTLAVELEPAAQPATRADIQLLLDRIDALEARLGR